MILFFSVALVSLLAHIDFAVANTSAVGKLVAWSHHGGSEYAIMIAVIYIVWGVYVVAASNDPIRHRLIIEFTIIGNLAHMTAMAIMAIADHQHRAHLVGDVPLGLVIPIALTALWLPVRGRSLPDVQR